MPTKRFRQIRRRLACSRSRVRSRWRRRPRVSPRHSSARTEPIKQSRYKQGRVRVFHLVERSAPWTLQPGLTVMANTYNGVVPGPALVVRQGDTLVIDYTNDGATPDSIHMHGVHDIPVAMDGVGGISQPLVPRGGHFVYRFVADHPGTFIYHSHDNEAMLDSGSVRRDYRRAVGSAPGRTWLSSRLPRDDLVLANSKRRRKSFHAQR